MRFQFVETGDGVRSGRAEEPVSPIRVPTSGLHQRLVEEVVVVERDAVAATGFSVVRKPHQVLATDVVLPGFMEQVEKRSSQFRRQEAILVCRVSGIFGLVVGHLGIEARHQAFDVDASSLGQTSLPANQTARTGETAGPAIWDFVVEFVDEQQRAANKCAGKPGARDNDVTAGDGRRGA